MHGRRFGSRLVAYAFAVSRTRRDHSWRSRIAALVVGLLAAVVLPEVVARILGLRAAPQFLERVTIDGRDGFRGKGRQPPNHVGCNTEFFPAEAPHGVLRIGAFGASTVAGTPYFEPFRIWTWLQDELQARLPGIQVEVLDFGQPGANLELVRQLVDELPGDLLDLAIVYAGHNEFFDLYCARSRAEKERTVLGHAVQAYLRLRFPSWLLSISGTTNVFVPAKPDKLGPLTSDPDQAELREWMYSNIERDYGQLLDALQQRAARVLCVLPASNLESIDTHVAYLADGGDPARQELGLAAVGAAIEQFAAKDLQAALTAAQRACRQFPEFSTAHLARARVLQAMGHPDAEEAHLTAQDLDLRPLGATRRLRHTLQRAAAARDVPVCDAHHHFTASGVPRAKLFVDAVHPTTTGQRLVANLLAQTLRGLHWPRPADQWRASFTPDATLTAGAETAELAVSGWRALAALQYAVASGAKPQALDRVIADFRHAMAQSPDQASFEAGLGTALLFAGNEIEGRRHLRNAIERAPRVEEWLRDAIQQHDGLRALLDQIATH